MPFSSSIPQFNFSDTWRAFNVYKTLLMPLIPSNRLFFLLIHSALHCFDLESWKEKISLQLVNEAETDEETRWEIEEKTTKSMMFRTFWRFAKTIYNLSLKNGRIVVRKYLLLSFAFACTLICSSCFCPLNIGSSLLKYAK